MARNSSQYIDLHNGENVQSEIAEKRYQLESRTVHLSGKNWGWIWNRPRGIMIEEGDQSQRVPILDYSRITQAVFYGVSFILGLIGMIFMIGRKGGEQHG